jgi:hypothetical protein
MHGRVRNGHNILENLKRREHVGDLGKDNIKVYVK